MGRRPPAGALPLVPARGCMIPVDHSGRRVCRDVTLGSPVVPVGGAGADDVIPGICQNSQRRFQTQPSKPLDMSPMTAFLIALLSIVAVLCLTQVAADDTRVHVEHGDGHIDQWDPVAVPPLSLHLTHVSVAVTRKATTKNTTTSITTVRQSRW